MNDLTGFALTGVRGRGKSRLRWFLVLLLAVAGFGCGKRVSQAPAGLEGTAPPAAAAADPAQAKPQVAGLTPGSAGEPAGPALSTLVANWTMPDPGPAAGGEALSPQARAAQSYLQGVEALRAGNFQAAVPPLSQAITADEDNADYHRARGVARTLTEDFPSAIDDLQRAIKLRPDDREAKVWLAAAYRMSGDAQKGAMYYTHGGDVPADYASHVYNDMAMDYFRSRYQGVWFDREAKRTVPVHEAVKTLFPEVAAAYAQRHGATGAAATEAVLARMKAGLERGDFAAAAQDLILLRRPAQDDPVLRGQWARCLLGLGNALQAREEFTRTLNVLPLWGEGYLGRAQAAALIGDERRARADLDSAAEMEAPSLEAARAKVAKLLPPRPPDDAVEQLTRSAAGGVPWPALVEAALAVHLRTNARRLRFDEAYQDRIFLLSEAIRDNPKDPDRAERLARFLFNNVDVAVIWNGPRGGQLPLRPQSRTEQQQEMGRALELTDAALCLDGRHANSMATKGWILYRLGKGGAAEQLADRGLEIAPQNVRLLRLKVQSLTDDAAGLEGQASALRAGHTETEREQRSDGVYEITRHYPPSAEQLAQALALEAQAAELRKQAGQVAAEAHRVESEVIPALLKEGDAALAAGDVSGAAAKFERAYAYQPDLAELYPRLADVRGRQGDRRGQRLFALLAESMRHTTAAGDLKVAWDAAARTAWQEASEALDRAAAADPADARTAAYRSAVARNRSDPALAHRLRRTALALEEARARLMGTSFLSPGGGPIDPQEAGLTLAVCLEDGEASLAAGDNEQAAKVLAANVAFEKRLAKDEVVSRVPSAMLPDPAADANTVPEAPTFASLLAWSRLGTARAYLALKRPADAQAEFRAVRAALANWPITAEARETMNVADSWARLGLAEAAVAAGDNDAAFQLLMAGEGWPGNLPEDLEKRKKALSDQVVAARRQAGENALRLDAQMTPQQRQVRALQQQIEGLERQRQATQASLNNPGLSPRETQALTQSVQQLDQLIAGMKGRLAQLQQGP